MHFSTHGVFQEGAVAAPLARGRFGQICFTSQNDKGRGEEKKPTQIKSCLFVPPKERRALAAPHTQ